MANQLNLCKKCGCDCVLISEECIYAYSNLSTSIPLDSISLVIKVAHNSIKKLFKKCFAEICQALEEETEENPLPEWVVNVLESKEFKLAIGSCIWYHWLRLKGGGEATPKGLVAESGDQETAFVVRKAKDITLEISNADKLKKELCDDFIEWMKAQNLPCACPPKIEKCPTECKPISRRQTFRLRDNAPI